MMGRFHVTDPGSLGLLSSVSTAAVARARWKKRVRHGLLREHTPATCRRPRPKPIFPNPVWHYNLKKEYSFPVSVMHLAKKVGGQILWQESSHKLLGRLDCSSNERC
uniref:Uncharacterized protein n=1 Tax=Oryza glumipatula TaxID=40148 RepID=A0A0E0BQQ8_9ORYZ